MALNDINETYDVETGLGENETLYIFSLPYDHEKDGLPFIHGQNGDLAFALDVEEALEMQKEMIEQVGEGIIVWELVQHKVVS